MKKSTGINIALYVVIGIVLVTAGFFFGRWLKNRNVKPVADTPQTVVEEVEDKKEEPVEKEPEAILPTGEVAPEVIEIGGSNEVIRTMSQLEYEEFADSEVPAFYSEFSAPGLPARLLGFLDKDGNVQLRTYGSRWKLENNVKKEKVTGFWAVLISKDLNGNYKINVTGDAAPANDGEEAAAVINACEEEKTLPSAYVLADAEAGVYKMVDVSGASLLRKWGKVADNAMLFPCDADGKIANGALPVIPEEEAANALAEGAEPNGGTNNLYPAKVGNDVILSVIAH